MIEDHCVDLLYPAYNRLEFTRETFAALLANTDWRYVHELFVYDDGSVDGTREWLENNIAHVPVRTRFLKTNFGSPSALQLHFIQSASAPILAKTDNDAMLPHAWLRLSLEVFDRHSELLLLGTEAMYAHDDDVHLPRSYTPAEFISGLGLYRRSTFDRGLFTPFDKYYGFEEWQIAQGSALARGWITPSLPVFLLDRFPFEPWLTYSNAYIQLGWQRPWGKHHPQSTLWHWRWPQRGRDLPPVGAEIGFPPGQPPVFKIVIPSARGANLLSCVQSVLVNEPEVPPEHIIVVDDGSRLEIEKKLPPIRWVPGVKPFVYTRNLNIGIREAASDVIVLDDDARLLTPRGFTSLSLQARSRPNLGVCSAGIQGHIGNPTQVAIHPSRFRLTNDMLSFVCAYVPRIVYEQLGPLDERFSGYGFGDHDYCTRALRAGFHLGVWDGCIVDHSAEQSSTYRTRSDLWPLFEQNRQFFIEKWEGKYD